MTNDMDAVRMVLRWRVAPGEAASLTSALQTLMVRARAAPGCTGCSLSTDFGAGIEIKYVSTWESERDLQREIRSRDFTLLAELMEHAIDPPTIEFALPSGVQGLEYAERIRQDRSGPNSAA
jgi:quinol monooxygenase YgiN